VQDPKQAGVIVAGKGPLAVAAEQIERSPAERRGALRPPVIEEPAVIVDELRPPLPSHIRAPSPDPHFQSLQSRTNWRIRHRIQNIGRFGRATFMRQHEFFDGIGAGRVRAGWLARYSATSGRASRTTPRYRK
jgi:hypothetical protein